jgi:hypothetical protein
MYLFLWDLVSFLCDKTRLGANEKHRLPLLTGIFEAVISWAGCNKPRGIW